MQVKNNKNIEVLFLTQYFPPEVGAPQTRIYELTQKLSNRGYNVKVLTTFPNYPKGKIFTEYKDKNKFIFEEKYNDIKIYRSFIYETKNNSFIEKIIAQLSFAFSSFIAFTYLFLTKKIKPNLCIVESPPLFIAFSAILIRLFFKIPYVFNVADIWPDAAIDLKILKNKFLIKIALFIEYLAYHFSNKVVTVTRGFLKDIIKKGILSNKVTLLPNGVDINLFSPEKLIQNKLEFEKNKNLLIEKLEIDVTKKIVLCSGTLGMSHKIDSLLYIAKEFENDMNVTFLIVGDGSEREYFINLANKLNLKNVIFKMPIKKELMPYLIFLSTVCVCSLMDTPSFNGRILARTYEYMAMGKPLLVLASGEMCALILTANAGFTAHPNDIKDATLKLKQILDNKNLQETFGKNAKKFVTLNFSRDKICDGWEKLINTIHNNIN